MITRFPPTFCTAAQHRRRHPPLPRPAGTYELTPEQRRKAQERRLEAAAAALKETEAERREALAAKKAERLLAEKVRMHTLAFNSI